MQICLNEKSVHAYETLTDSGEFKKLSAFQKCKPDLLLAFWPNNVFDFLGGTDGQEGICQEADQAKPTR